MKSHSPHLHFYILFYLGILLSFKTTLFAQENDKINTSPSLTFLLKKAKSEIKKNHTESALEYYKKILIINPNNKEALLGLKKMERLHKKYAQEVHEETRTSLLNNVEEAWEYPTNNKSALPDKEQPQAEEKDNDRSAIVAKLNTLIIPLIELEDVSISEAIDYLRQKGTSLDPTKKGINIVLTLPPLVDNETAPSTEPTQPHIFLQLHDVPLYVALEYVAKQADLNIRIDPYSVVLSPRSELSDIFITKEYCVSSRFIPLKKETSEIEHQSQDIAYPAKEYLENQGVTFPEGSSANYILSSNKLIIHNTKENIEIIDILISSYQNVKQSQISIETKFIEVSQDQLEQLGFNWLLGSFQVGNSGLDLSGGGSITTLNTNAYPFPASGMNPLGSLQMGNNVTQDNSIDAAIDHGLGTPNGEHAIPGVFSVGGVYTTPQFQAVLRMLHQKKGIDLMAAPHVTTKNGVKAVVKIIDEFIYPTQYTPPQIPQSTTNSGNNTIIHETPPTIAPAFPSSWATKNLGVILEAKPTIGPDGYTIELELHPQITDFDGFINYGTPINTIGYNFSATNASMVPFSSTLTTNTINQPVFTVREVSTSVTVWDGQTVILGGLIREDVQKFEDKIPFLGDIPIAGKLFRSKADKKLKKNLIIFVTPRIINTEGTPVL